MEVSSESRELLESNLEEVIRLRQLKVDISNEVVLTDDISIEKETQESRIPQPDEDDMKDVTSNVSASDNLPLEGHNEMSICKEILPKFAVFTEPLSKDTICDVQCQFNDSIPKEGHNQAITYKELLAKLDEFTESLDNVKCDVEVHQFPMEGHREIFNYEVSNVSVSTQPLNMNAKQDVGVQFDDLTPMEDLLHGALLAGQKLFLVHGDQHQFFVWEECGFKLRSSLHTITPLDMCAVRVSALAGGNFIFPEGIELASAVYAVTISAPILKDLEIQLQHCLDISDQRLIKNVLFAVASSDSSTSGYEFHLVDDERFTLQNEYGSIHISSSACYCIVFKKEHFILNSVAAAEMSKIKQNANREELTEGSQEEEENSGNESSHNESGNEGQDVRSIASGGEEDQSNDDSGEGGMGEGGDENSDGDESSEKETSDEEMTNEEDECSESEEEEVKQKEDRLKEMTVIDLQQCQNETYYETTTKKQPGVAITTDEHTELDVNGSAGPLALRSTKSSRPAVDSSCWYYGQIFSEKIMRKTWNAKFMVTKRLNTLKTYVEKSIPHAKDAGPSIRFKFKHEYLSVVYDEQEVFEEWEVTPHVKSPFQIHKESVDMFGWKREPNPPSCWFEVEALKDSCRNLKYPIDIQDILPPCTIRIIVHNTEELFEGEASRYMQQHQSQIRRQSIPQFDIENLKKLIVKVIENHYAKLSELFDELPKSITNEMFEAKLISSDVRKNPTADKIMNDLIHLFDWKDEKSGVEKYCKKILKILYNNGGNYKRAAKKLKANWLEKAQNEMGVELNLD